jgi:uncharacterized protein
MVIDNPQFLSLIRKDLRVSLEGIHGIRHWERVYRIGSVLSHRMGADLQVVQAFAWVHDARRYTDGSDPDHGKRGAAFARQINDQYLYLTAGQLDVLCTACTYHSRGDTAMDPTVGTCWDADRLDLARLSIEPDPGMLSTSAARDEEFICWACSLSADEESELQLQGVASEISR